MTRPREVKVALLGATGAVGQRYINMLPRHPYLHLEALMGGESAGKKYGEAVHWLFPDPIDPEMAGTVVKRAKPESAKGCDIVFSALPSEVAAEVETKFAEAGFTVVSEASAHRMDADVPLMIPEINAEHLALLESQKRKRGWKGAIATTPNCTGTGLSMVLKPLIDQFGAKRAIVTTMQALSGAGFPGVPSLSIQENVIPYIKNEEEKVAAEAKKILGTLSNGVIKPSPIAMGISCNRVAVIDGHMETLYADLSQEVTPRAAEKSLETFRGEPQRLKLPTAPDHPIIVRKEDDRPQPRLDRLAGSVPGMSVVVGRVRNGIDGRSIQLTLLSHNTIRGAAGTAILTAELMESEGYLGT
ncbi:MAG: aspartate-semialdehyde dehydrogenase [Nitrososphaerota archaeon]|nr:aspartate-semialdehyde dehydrogenase [Nitrososphaerota archaeon]MDG6978753.1 aspartate-semialdehyde dehydrogenase [Nitrososphaerota archaeon]MDG7021288.1 aspartate-semialdehyde dehydrogenase [Nitrososphaerota archaeon]MDG7022693.1 aspartate-semialdehyde dehydrogenase [Nitrososphaerota archaeon]